MSELLYQFSRLYSNIGDKVCAVAKICGIIGLISAAAGVVFFPIAWITQDSVFYALAPALAVSGFGLLISSWPLYAFGQITNDIQSLKNK